MPPRPTRADRTPWRFLAMKTDPWFVRTYKRVGVWLWRRGWA